MKVIACLGRKGGGGKTACSHILAMAFGLAGWKPVLVQTDLRTALPPLNAPGRPYWLFGLNTAAEPEKAAESMAQVFERAKKTEGSVVILDGGANRDAVDEGLARRADLVLIPVADGPEDFEVAEADRKRFEALLRKRGGGGTPVQLLLNRWPGRRAEMEAFEREDYVRDFMQRTEGVRLRTVVPRLKSAKALLDHASPESGHALRKVGRTLLDEVVELLGERQKSAAATKAGSGGNRT